MGVNEDRRLVIVSNRGPAEFHRAEDGERTVRRGGGGLVTALSGLVAHRGALWIASAMTEEDIARQPRGRGPARDPGDRRGELRRAARRE